MLQFQAGVIQAIETAQLSPPLSLLVKASGVLDAIVVVGKTMDQAGIPIAEALGDLGIAERQTITKEQALGEVLSGFSSGTLKAAAVVGISIVATEGITLPVVLPGAALGVMALANSTVLDADTILYCDDDNLYVIRSGLFNFYGCDQSPANIIPFATVTANITDQNDTPLSGGSLHLISKDSFGEGFVAVLDTGGSANIPVPLGDYQAMVGSEGFTPKTVDLTVPVGGTSINETLEPVAPPIQVAAPGSLPPATVGFVYTYSFCKPDLARTSDLCGPFTATTNPTGGQPPYHFVLDSGVGFPPFGISLNLNGLLTGTPTAEGTRTFRVCAVDLAGAQTCQTTSLTVSPPLTFTATTTGGSGGPAPFTANFTASASGGKPPYTYLWDFGDGQTSTLPNTSHTYTNPGTFTVRITFTDSDGRTRHGIRTSPYVITSPSSSGGGQCSGNSDFNSCGSCRTDSDCPGGVCWTGNPPAPFC